MSQNDGQPPPVPDDITQFLADRQSTTDSRNREEFCGPASGELPARLSVQELDRNIHVRSLVVDNQEGPLSRSIVIGSTSNKLVSPHGPAHLGQEDRPVFNALEERVRNIETHLGIVVAPIDRTLVERIKVLEDKILRIEQFYPQIAAHVFNYGKAEVEASSRPGGRVSRLPGYHQEEAAAATARHKRKRASADEYEDQCDGLGPEQDSPAPAESPSLVDLRKRMEEVKKRLLKQVRAPT